MPGRLTNLDNGRTRTYYACSRCRLGLFGNFSLVCLFSSFLPLWEAAICRPKYCLRGPLNLKQSTNHSLISFNFSQITINVLSLSMRDNALRYIETKWLRYLNLFLSKQKSEIFYLSNWTNYFSPENIKKANLVKTKILTLRSKETQMRKAHSKQIWWEIRTTHQFEG